MFSYHGTKLLCLGYYLHEIMYMYSGFFNNGVLRSLQTVALPKKLKISKALKSLHRFSFNKQTAEFSAILCNRDRAIRLSLKDTVIKMHSLETKADNFIYWKYTDFYNKTSMVFLPQETDKQNQNDLNTISSKIQFDAPCKKNIFVGKPYVSVPLNFQNRRDKK